MYRFISLHAPSRFTRFARDDSGAVTADWTVLTGAVVGLGLLVGGVVSNGVGSASGNISAGLDANYIAFMTANFGQSPYDVAGDVELNHYGSKWPDRRMDKLLNETSDKSLVTQHKRWSSRASDPNYSDPGKAADQVAMIEIAMDSRGLSSGS